MMRRWLLPCHLRRAEFRSSAECFSSLIGQKLAHNKPIKFGHGCLPIQNEQTTQVLPCVQVPGNYGEIISMLIDQSEGLD